MKLYTTGEFISNDILFEKKKIFFTTKLKLYTTSITRFDLKNLYSSYSYKHYNKIKLKTYI